MKKILTVLIACIFLLILFTPVSKVNAEDNSDVDVTQGDYFGIEVHCDVINKITCTRTSWTVEKNNKEWWVRHYEITYAVELKPIYYRVDGTTIPKPFYADIDDLQQITQTIVPQLTKQGDESSYTFYSGEQPFDSLIADNSYINNWQEIYANSLHTYTPGSNLLSGGESKSIFDEEMGQEGALKTFFEDTYSFMADLQIKDTNYPTNLQEYYYTTLNLFSFFSFSSQDNVLLGDQNTITSYPVAVPNAIKFHQKYAGDKSIRVVKEFTEKVVLDVYVRLPPDAINVTEPYYASIILLGQKVTGNDWHSVVKEQPISLFDTAVRTADVYAQHFSYEISWGYFGGASEYDQEAPIPEGKQYPNGGEPNEDIQIFNSPTDSATVKYTYKCQEGSGEGLSIPGFEGYLVLFSILSLIVIMKVRK